MALPERAAAQVKVPVGEVATIAYATVFGRLGFALELGWVPLLVMLAVELVPGVAESLTPAPPDATAPPFAVADLVHVVAALLCLNAFAVRWYRALLLSSGGAVPRRIFVEAWLRFIAYTLLFSVPMAGPAVALAFSGASVGPGDAPRMFAGAAALVGLAVALAVLRLSLVWPAAAQRTPMGLREAWRRMRGNTWRLVAVALLVSAPIFLTAGFVVSIIITAAHVDLDQLPSHPPLGFVLLAGVADTVLQFVFVALSATVLTEFYRRIMRTVPAERSGDQ